jgi:hypothetical protein
VTDDLPVPGGPDTKLIVDEMFKKANKSDTSLRTYSNFWPRPFLASPALSRPLTRRSSSAGFWLSSPPLLSIFFGAARSVGWQRRVSKALGDRGKNSN